MIKLKQILVEKTINGWEKQNEWWGNPSLKYESYKKMFKNPYTDRRVPVFIFGKDNKWSFNVHAGKTSEFSYTGGFPNNINNLKDRMNYVDKLYNTKLPQRESHITYEDIIPNKLFP